MKNSRVLFREIIARISLRENPEEIQTMVYLLLEHFLSLSRTDIMSGKVIEYAGPVSVQLQNAIERINLGEPIQYVIGYEYFFGRKFHVNQSVLIPRPETEELVRLVLSHARTLTAGDDVRPLKILDIGTGSGCIAITLSAELRNAEIFGTDVSNAALSVASGNANALNARVTFVEHDILREVLPFDNLDIVVSNPPYVTSAEKASMQPNVLDFEPHTALFVPSDDPLLFYEKIAEDVRKTLTRNGFVAVEVNENFADQVSTLFRQNGFASVLVTKDISGKDRIVSGSFGP
ncbi:MAG TPA: peptide chain release factor N(5)-glutamine methyltransferase [Chryseosolibacter sp.]|nr:peptide chain release factor N(5)-glutamine methyltransferase [Chryseosolibacter sp.]